jgi:hypothetical protein
MGSVSHDDHDNDRTGTTVSEAARILGITEGAVRKRVERGKLAADRAPDGRLIVYLDRDTTATDTTRDRTRQSRGPVGEGVDSDLVEELRDRVASLERQLDVRTEELKEHRRLLAAALERIPPQLEPPAEAPPDERDAPETASTGGDAGPPPRSDAPGPQEGARRPWWRRLIGS